jgi:hypothetical protein
MFSRSEALFDHIADIQKFISSALSFWFTLDTSYDHGCHLARCIRLDPEEYEALLIVAGLAHYTRFGVALKPTAWSKFLGLGGRGDENITINHGCGGGDCGGSGNSDGNSDGGGGSCGGDGGDGGSRESDGGVGGGRGDDSYERRQ